ncbi:cytochrome d ubiquinol oxidase subunit II [Marinobacterium lutimaris]|uniref:Cytochrome bd-I ubiquinol oxidase subunit 2 apoprotein n=1 Tax=Marinobacterium lutimaris TaxID=568106 RepID=A0A1H5VJV8_9GAMM|nr:cytochrome d ubiquinol oxidase subunit II [Marinobacterium lutimaris]SEF87118.1 cytochrome bd-I ubiquinol oxidase subunit 2 apoprotein [Marinobacterium lutimaris]
MGIDTAAIWAVIILVGVMLYVIADGFDLGVGLLFPFVNGEKDRDRMMASVAPIWDGNETWLVLGGAALMAAFPLAYAVVLSALYLPIVFMLIGLILRGVAFEARAKSSDASRHLWNKAFFAGSLLASFSQGVTLGSYLNGIRVVDGQFAGTAWDWISPFSLFCGVALSATYALLGSTWLIMKTDGLLQSLMRRLTYPLVIMLLVFMLVVSIWTPLGHPAIAERWFSLPNLYWLAPLPIVTLLACVWLLCSVKQGEATPFLMTLVVVMLGFIGLGISLWPNVIPPALNFWPPGIDIWEASSPVASQGFALVGALVIIPIILMYSAWSYYVFRGKVSAEDAYH